ncbi:MULTISPECIES: fumarylacetoacetate hydrolase family protein [unclassified Colwellia]|jgi:2-keto-4-pentenoate hydratase/2-oxohepta-3-ene-1,7-dioic acid hydratase in catechol pathway|uniref:fumarylacetoacetate hydrolase family protein n=1 Tax=unclassified Colwellia TaxID=196834 RepID=UPI0015F56A8F|nr:MULTISPECIES: fumarylacetoacetate hydrolase family protein [unclassified Colwellia]MBA6231820.1 fumarylacetoacetate hydrolase family protein [Colwellia sp. MB02u-7]MBA6235775.1 fumarylacetoacetate hydrolase family protein [Colwellia sp. MB02u-11]MBA6298864.1 fumarylacetoacetate hydrolase family protein [Colwellia sp. MB3u-22]MBA6309848.1 fumarylacetoacetate hydrolase family protein [Colwellia sp. MB3u-64]
MNNVKYEGINFQPTKIVCIGRNYVEHIEELNNETPSEPVIFIKPNSAISDHIESNQDEEIHYEGEISFIIENNKISGIGFGLDLTKRAVQKVLKSKGLPWERAKAFNKSAVFSDFVRCSDDYKSYKMELFIDNHLKQLANYELMINKPEILVAEIQTFLTLEDGDIIMTGTPKGVGVINSGELFTAKIYKNEQVIIEKSWCVDSLYREKQ